MSRRQSWADDSGAKSNEGGGWPQRWTFDRNCLGLHVFEMMIQPGADELTEATTQQLCHIRSPGFVSEVPRIGQLAEFVRIFVRVESEAGVFPN